jgi:hypothetical protein
LLPCASAAPDTTTAAKAAAAKEIRLMVPFLS